MAKTVEPLRSVRDHLSEFVDRAEREHERIVVTRNGRPAAVLLAYDDLAAREETLDVLSDPAALADIRVADAEVARGDVTFRVLYRIDDAEHLVAVVRVEHRADACRRR